MTEPSAQQDRRATYVVPAVCWVLSVGLLGAFGVLSSSDPEIAGVPAFGDPLWWVALGVLTYQAVALGALRRHPRAALLAVAAGMPALLGAGTANGVGLVTVLVATYLAVVARPPSRLVPTLVGAGTLVAVGVAAVEARNGGDVATVLVAGLLQALATIGLPSVLGSVVGARQDALTALAGTAEAQHRERDALVQVAVERERTAMARELHDIAAHHLSGIAVMTGAIGRQIDVDPEGAKVAVGQVREQSTAMLRDLRNLVVLLRDVDVPAEAGAPVRMETLAGIDDLVARAREAGAVVALETVGPVAQVAASGAVGPLAQLAAYRVVQEALANAARHAPGAPCTVRLDASAEGRVEVVVRNARPDRGEVLQHHDPGYGLVGMQERAELTGADLRYGRTLDGGWQVTLSVPAAGTSTAGESMTSTSTTSTSTTSTSTTSTSTTSTSTTSEGQDA